MISPTWPSGVSTPSYSRWAIDIVRFGLNDSLRLASCWRVEVVNGGAGERFWVRTPTLRTTGCASRSAVDVALGGRLVGDVERLAVDADQLGRERLAGGGREDRLDRPVLARGERLDLALALDDEADGDRLDAAGRQAAADLARQQRAQRVADEPVDDPPRLLRVDEVLGRCHADGRTPRGSRGSVISLNVTRRVFSAGTCAASATCQAIASPSRSRSVAR